MTTEHPGAPRPRKETQEPDLGTDTFCRILHHYFYASLIPRIAPEYAEEREDWRTKERQEFELGRIDAEYQAVLIEPESFMVSISEEDAKKLGIGQEIIITVGMDEDNEVNDDGERLNLIDFSSFETHIAPDALSWHESSGGDIWTSPLRLFEFINHSIAEGKLGTEPSPYTDGGEHGYLTISQEDAKNNNDWTVWLDGYDVEIRNEAAKELFRHLVTLWGDKIPQEVLRQKVHNLLQEKLLQQRDNKTFVQRDPQHHVIRSDEIELLRPIIVAIANATGTLEDFLRIEREIIAPNKDSENDRR